MKRRRIAYLMFTVLWVALVMSKVTVVAQGPTQGVYLEWGQVRLSSDYDVLKDRIYIGFTFRFPR